MAMVNLRPAAIAALTLIVSATVFADVPSRPANPQELAVIRRVVTAVNTIFDRFVNSEWQQRSASEHEEFSVATEPDRPINFAMSSEREFEIRPGSALFNAKVKPVQDAAEAHDFAKLQALSKQIDGATSFSVEADANVPGFEFAPSDLAHDLGAKGAAFSYCESGEELDCYVWFGDRTRWKSADGNMRKFSFAHPNGTPAVENLNIRFHAKSRTGMAADRIRELIRTTDWSAIAAAMTK